MRTPKYSSGDDFARPKIDFNTDQRVVFMTGLGLPMRNQGEPFLRRFALLNHVSFMALDFDAITSEKTEKENFGLKIALERAMEEISHLPEDRLILMGPCFGGLMAYRVAQEFPKKVQAVLTTSPLIDFNQGQLSQHMDNFLTLREERLRKRGIPEESLQKMSQFRQKVVWGANEFGQLPVESAYQGEMMIVHGEKDRLIPIENSREIAQKLNRKNVSFQSIPLGSHTFDMDKERRMMYSIAALKKQLSR